MRKLTKELYEELKPYEKDITNAYKNSFVHVSGDIFAKIHEIYKKVFGEGLTKSQMGCNSCRLNALRKLGELYVTYNKEKSPRGRKPKLDDGKEEVQQTK